MKYLRIYNLTKRAMGARILDSEKKSSMLDETLKEYERRKYAEKGQLVDIFGSFEIRKSEKGKPFALDGPEFSISHSGPFWGCVVSEDPVGFDIQIMKEDADFAGISRRFFTEAEYNYLINEDNNGSGLDAFYSIWVRKEAYIKLTGKGLSQGLSTFSVADENGVFDSVNNEEKYWFTDIEECSVFDEYFETGVKGVICSEIKEEIVTKLYILDI